MTKAIATCILAAGLAALPLWAPFASAAEPAPHHCAQPGAPAAQNIRACLAAVGTRGARPSETAANYFELASAYEAQGDRLRERDALDKAIALDPRAWQPRLRRAQLYLQAADMEKALADYWALSKAYPEAAAPAKPSVPPKLAGANSPANAAPSSETAFLSSALASLKRNLPERFVQRCRTRAIGGLDLNGAISDCNTALQIDPTLAVAHEPRGIAEFRSARWPAALADFETVLKLDPDAFSARYLKGITERRMGNISQGDADLAAVKAHNPRIFAAGQQFGLLP